MSVRTEDIRGEVLSKTAFERFAPMHWFVSVVEASKIRAKVALNAVQISD